MGLNLVAETVDFDPWVKYNAKAGRWYIKGDDGNEKEVDKPTFVADMANIKTGWILFLEGQAPSKEFDPSLEQMLPKPSDAHKRGFQLRLFSGKSFGGVVELCSSSMHLCKAIAALYTEYEANAKDGQVPVVEYTGSTGMKDKMGTNYAPNFKIVKYVDRPAEFDATAEPEAAAPTPASVEVSDDDLF